MIEYNTLVVLVGCAVLGAGAGLVGTFAVLRRRALTGDALAHAALPGLCLAFMVIGERRPAALLTGAFVTGLLGVLTIVAIRRFTRIKEDAAIGLVLSTFFGVGLALIAVIQKQTGRASTAGLKTYLFGQAATMIDDDIWLISAASLLCLAVIALLYKEFKLVAFDAGFAKVQGWPSFALDLTLMALLAVIVVIGLPAVGVILMAALVILPPATARLWTDRLGFVLLLAAGFGSMAGMCGALISAMPTGPVIVIAGTILFLLSLLFAPRRGLLARIVARSRFRQELEDRRLLGELYDVVEPQLPERPAIAVNDLAARRRWPSRRLERLLERAARRQLVAVESPGRYQLTEIGLQRAAEVARGQRLWALFLSEYPDLTAMTDLAEESVNTIVPTAIVDELSERLRADGRLPVTAPAAPSEVPDG